MDNVSLPSHLAATFRASWGHTMVAESLATILTRTELDALADMLAALGEPDMAIIWRELQSDADMRPDSHSPGAEDEADPEAAIDQAATQTVCVPVGLTISETATYYLKATVSVPAHLADDPDALRGYLTDEQDAWLDGLDHARHFQFVEERDVDRVVVLAAPGG